MAAMLAGCGGSDDKRSSGPPEPKSNGIEDLEPAEAMKEAADATRFVTDLTLEGTGPFPFESGPIRADVRIAVTKRGDCEVVMTAKEIGTITTRKVRQTSYIRAGVKGWTVGFGAPATGARLFAGKWLSQPVSESQTRCSVFELSAQTIDPDTCVRGKEGELDGTPTLQFDCRDGGDPISLDLATVGEPLAYRIHGEDEDGPFDLRLVDHDSGVRVLDPPKRLVIDGTQLQQ